MEIDELYKYYLEKEGCYDENTSAKKMYKIMQKVHQDLTNPRTKIGRVCYDYYWLQSLEGNELKEIDEERVKKDFEEYKEVVSKILKNVPDDYDLKAYLIYNGIDYETFDEESYKNYRDNRYFKFLIKEVNNLGEEELSLSNFHEILQEKLKKYDVDFSCPDSDKITKKLNVFLDEIEKIISEKESDEQNDRSYSLFVLGRMYLRIIDRLLVIYDTQDDKDKEKYILLKKAFDKDCYLDSLFKNNELGFISYKLKEMDTYNEVVKFNKFTNKNGLMEYILSNLSNIFENKNNSKYLRGIIKKNFYFLPFLVFKSEIGIEANSITKTSKGSLEEAIKMINYYVLNIRSMFKEPDEYLIKSYTHTIEEYFNYYFDDNGLTYTFFIYLQEFYMDDKEVFLISDLKNKYLEEYDFISDEEFEVVFKNLCSTKLIKKRNKINFVFDDSMQFMIEFDLIGDTLTNKIFESDDEDDEIIDNLLKA